MDPSSSSSSSPSPFYACFFSDMWEEERRMEGGFFLEKGEERPPMARQFGSFSLTQPPPYMSCGKEGTSWISAFVPGRMEGEKEEKPTAHTLPHVGIDNFMPFSFLPPKS